MDAQVVETKKRSFLWSSLPFFILAHAAHHFLTALPQPLLPAIRDEFNLSYSRVAFVPMAFALSGATGQLPSGWMADRFGPVILIAIGTVGVAMAGVLIGLSQTFLMLICFLVLMGLLSGGYHPAATPLISARRLRRTRAVGITSYGCFKLYRSSSGTGSAP